LVVQVAAEVNADLIVLNTHGRRGLSRFILGNVAEEVVRTASCPVQTLNPVAQEKAAHL
jgi:nucleotide-binding universal stress UspA family protein